MWPGGHRRRPVRKNWSFFREREHRTEAAAAKKKWKGQRKRGIIRGPVTLLPTGGVQMRAPGFNSTVAITAPINLYVPRWRMAGDPGVVVRAGGRRGRREAGSVRYVN